MTTLQENLDKLERLLTGQRFELADELRLQHQLSLYFSNFILFKEEKKLGPRKRVDFFYEGIAIELKVGGNPRKVFKQLEKYAECEEVKAILLITSKSFQMPAEIMGKPCRVFHLSRAWL